MLLFFLACQNTKSITEDLEDTASEIEETETTEESSCFTNPPAEPFLIYSSPHGPNGEQVNLWNIVQNDGVSSSFEMGRTVTGQVHISSDGSWGVVAQEDGSLGIFQQEEGVITVLEESFVASTDSQEIYASELWLDSTEGVLWITDQNWPNNGGGLFKATIDCENGSFLAIEQVFSSKNAYSVRPLGENLVYLSREIEEEAYQLTVFDEQDSILAQGRAFEDDEAIFSALSTDSTNILVGENNGFSGIPNRISHLGWNGSDLVKSNEFELEDPMSIVILDDWALISSGFGDSLWQYQLSTQELSQVSTAALPSAIVQQGNLFYVAENTGIQKLELNNSGIVSQGMAYTTGGSIEGIVGAIGIFGEF